MKNLILLSLSILWRLNAFSQTSPVLNWYNLLNDSDGASVVITSSAVDNSGNLYLGGFFEDSIDIDPGSAINMHYSNGNEDFLLASYDPSGILRWGFTGGTASDEMVGRIKLNVNGELMVSLLSDSTVDLDPGPGIAQLPINGYTSYLLRYTTAGNFISGINIPLSINHLYPENSGDITTDTDGNVYISANVWGSADFNPGPGIDTVLVSTSGGDMVMASYDSALNFRWVRHLTGQASGGEILNCFAIDANNNILISGTIFGSNIVDFDGGSGTTNLSAGTFLVKYSTQGNLLWAKSLNGGQVRSLKIGTNNDLYLAGIFAGSLDADPGPGISLINSHGNYDFFILIYDSIANLKHAAGFGSLRTNCNEDLLDAKLGSDNSIYVTGWIDDSLDMDPGPGTHYLYPRTPNNTLLSWYAAKYSPTLQLEWAITPDTTQYSSYTTGRIIQPFNEGFYLSGTHYGYYDADPSAAQWMVGDSLVSGNLSGAFLGRFLEPYTNTVYPGDLDSSGVVDNFDLLPLGLHFNETGNARNLISNNWAPEVAPAWNNPNQGNGVNRVHADANGDGKINNEDTLAIYQNYGQIRSGFIFQNPLGGPEIKFVYDKNSYNINDTVRILISAGSVNTPMPPFAGLGFQLEQPSSYISSGSLKFTAINDWLAPSLRYLELTKVSGTNRIDYSCVRNNHSDTSGIFNIGIVEFIRSTFGGVGQVVTSNPLNLMLVDSMGKQVPINVIGDSAVFTGSTGTTEETINFNLIVSPNPGYSTFNVTASVRTNEPVDILIFDNIGHLMSQETTIPVSKLFSSIVNLDGITPGLYFIRLNQNGKYQSQKFIVLGGNR